MRASTKRRRASTSNGSAAAAAVTLGDVSRVMGAVYYVYVRLPAGSLLQCVCVRPPAHRDDGRDFELFPKPTQLCRIMLNLSRSLILSSMATNEQSRDPDLFAAADSRVSMQSPPPRSSNPPEGFSNPSFILPRWELAS